MHELSNFEILIELVSAYSIPLYWIPVMGLMFSKVIVMIGRLVDDYQSRNVVNRSGGVTYGDVVGTLLLTFTPVVNLFAMFMIGVTGLVDLIVYVTGKLRSKEVFAYSKPVKKKEGKVA